MADGVAFRTRAIAPAAAMGRLSRRLGFAAIVAGLCAPLAASGQAPVLADLSSHVVEITTGFVGADVVLFGATEAGNDIVVVIRGPAQSITVRAKRRVAGIWVNAPGLQFVQVPSFYAVAATRPIEELLPPEERALGQIGADSVLFAPSPGSAEAFTPAEIATHRAALLTQLQARGFYSTGGGEVSVLGGRLFRTDIRFPSDVPTGAYFVDVYEVRDSRIIGGIGPSLIVRKAGMEAEIFRFAHQRPALYGALAVLVAFAAGFLPTVIRRLR